MVWRQLCRLCSKFGLVNTFPTCMLAACALNLKLILAFLCPLVVLQKLVLDSSSSRDQEERMPQMKLFAEVGHTWCFILLWNDVWTYCTQESVAGRYETLLLLCLIDQTCNASRNVNITLHYPPKKHNYFLFGQVMCKILHISTIYFLYSYCENLQNLNFYCFKTYFPVFSFWTKHSQHIILDFV